MRVGLQQAATDPATGKIDISLITTGQSSTSRQRIAELSGKVRQYLTSRPQQRSYALMELIAEMSKTIEWVRAWCMLLIVGTVSLTAAQDVTRDIMHAALRELAESQAITMTSDVHTGGIRIRVLDV